MSEGKIGSYIYFIDSLFSILNSINLILQNLENRVYLVLVIYVKKIKIKKIVFKKIETPNWPFNLLRMGGFSLKTVSFYL